MCKIFVTHVRISVMYAKPMADNEADTDLHSTFIWTDISGINIQTYVYDTLISINSHPKIRYRHRNVAL